MIDDGATRPSREALLALLLLLAATPVWAHEQSGQAAGFLTGLQHPVSGLDHVLAMISVGLWGAQLGQPAVWLLPVVFPVVMAFGGFAMAVAIGYSLFALAGFEPQQLAILPIAVAAIPALVGLAAAGRSLMISPNCRPNSNQAAVCRRWS